MGTIKSYPSHYATQRAWWISSDGQATAAISAQNVTDDRGALGFSWELSASHVVNEHDDRLGFHHTSRPADYIYAPMAKRTDTLIVLETLASFVGAWSESVEYSERTGRESENADLFPASCRDFLPYAEEFSLDAMMELEDHDS